MDVSAVKAWLFRHGEKIVLAVVAVFVVYQVYSSFKGAEVRQGPATGPGQAPSAKVGEDIPADFAKAASPFVCVPRVTPPRYDYFHPPLTRWGRRATLDEKKEITVKRSVHGRIPRSPDNPEITPLSEEERTYLGLPEADTELTEPCGVAVRMESAAPGTDTGDVIVITGERPGRWIKVVATLDNQDKFCVAVMMSKPGMTKRWLPAPPSITEIMEEPLGTVVIRFTAPQGEVKSKDGTTTTTYIEPTYYAIHRKGQHDKEMAVIGRVDGRGKKEEPAGPGTPGTGAKEPAPAGFPGQKAAPAKKAPAVAPKGEGPKAATDLVFEDRDVESETQYIYEIESVVVSKEEGEEMKPERSGPKNIKTLERFSFAYVGGDAKRADITVFIGPRDKPLGMKHYKRVPIGSFVGDMPKELRTSATEAAGGDEEPGDDGPGAAPKEAEKELNPKEKAEQAAASRFVTRYIIVDIEQNVFHAVPQIIRVPGGVDAAGRPVFKTVETYQVRYDRRIILRDLKNRLMYLWWEGRPIAEPLPPKGGAKK